VKEKVGVGSEHNTGGLITLTLLKEVIYILILDREITSFDNVAVSFIVGSPDVLLTHIVIVLHSKVVVGLSTPCVIGILVVVVGVPEAIVLEGCEASLDGV
jgi:hypothetical protein